MATSPPSQSRSLLSLRLGSRLAYWVLVVLAVLAVAVGTWFVALPAIRAWQLTRAAEEAGRVEDLPRAAELLRRAVELRPADAQTRFLLARILRRLGDLSSARRELAEAARLGHRREDVDLENVFLLAQYGDLEAVEDTLQALVAAGHPDAELALEALVLGYLTLHDLRNADRWATHWLNRHPAAWKAWFLRGRTREQGVELDAALQDYLRAAELKPGDVEIQFRVGDMLRRLDRYNEALPHLQAVVQADPDNPARVVALARCLRSLGRTEESLRLLDDWRNNHAAAPAELLALMGRLAADLHRTEEALTWLRQAERLSPSDEETLITLATLFRELGQDAEAEKYDARARDAHQKLKRIDSLLRALKNEPRNVAIRYEIGWLLLTLGHDDKAFPWLVSALEQDPDHGPTHAALAEYYEALGDRETARNHRLAAAGKAKARVER